MGESDGTSGMGIGARAGRLVSAVAPGVRRRGASGPAWLVDAMRHRTATGEVHCVVVLDPRTGGVRGYSVGTAGPAGMVAEAIGAAALGDLPDGTAGAEPIALRYVADPARRRRIRRGRRGGTGPVDGDEQVMTAFWAALHRDVLDGRDVATAAAATEAIRGWLAARHVG